MSHCRRTTGSGDAGVVEQAGRTLVEPGVPEQVEAAVVRHHVQAHVAAPHRLLLAEPVQLTGVVAGSEHSGEIEPGDVGQGEGTVPSMGRT